MPVGPEHVWKDLSDVTHTVGPVCRMCETPLGVGGEPLCAPCGRMRARLLADQEEPV